LIKEVLTRVFVPPAEFRPTVEFYKRLTGGRCTLHFPFPERQLELAAVSSATASFLLTAGTPESLAPFKATALTVVVEKLAEAVQDCFSRAREQLAPIVAVPTGYQARFRHPDGLVVELVQHTEAADRFRKTEL
jgi:hypothetical protein